MYGSTGGRAVKVMCEREAIAEGSTHGFDLRI